MSAPHMKLAFVAPDGEGGWVLKVQTAEGTQQVLPMTLARAAQLQRQLAEAIAGMADGKSTPADAPTKWFQE